MRLWRDGTIKLKLGKRSNRACWLDVARFNVGKEDVLNRQARPAQNVSEEGFNGNCIFFFFHCPPFNASGGLCLLNINNDLNLVTSNILTINY